MENRRCKARNARHFAKTEMKQKDKQDTTLYVVLKNINIPNMHHTSRLQDARSRKMAAISTISKIRGV